MSKRIAVSKRNTGTRLPNKRIYILCEGFTELEYFKNFKARRVNVEVKISKSKHTDPLSLLNEAKQIIAGKQLDVKTGLDEMWCVFDLDTSPNNVYISNCIARARRNRTTIASSNPCFELWFVLHFQKINNYTDPKQLMAQLQCHVPSYQKGKCIFSNLKLFTTNAVNNAKELERAHEDTISKGNYKEANPYTQVYLLVQKLISLN